MWIKLENLIKNYKLNYTNSKKLVSIFRCIKCDRKIQPDKIIYFHHDKNKKYSTYPLGYYIISLITCKCRTKLLFKMGFDDEYTFERSRTYDYTISSLENLKEYRRLKRILKFNKYSVSFINVYNGDYNAIETDMATGTL